MKKDDQLDSGLQEIIAISQKYDYTKTFIAGAYIDAKDTINNWCVGEIKNVDLEKSIVYVHYEAWAYRYDESFKFTSNKIGPFRRYSQGYTGQTRNAYREFKFDPAKLQEYQSQVDNLTESSFTVYQADAFKFNQFIRGQLYFYIDSLLSLTKGQSPESFPDIVKFMKQVLKMILKWMEIFPEYVYYYELAQQYPQLYLVDIKTAIAACGPELFSILGKIFAKCERCQRFFKEAKYPVAVENKHCNASIRGFEYQKALINEFVDLNGFQLLANFLNLEAKDKNQKIVKICPMNYLQLIFNNFDKSREFLDSKVAIEFFEMQKQVLVERLNNLSDKDIKEISKDLLQNLVDLLNHLMVQTEDKGADELCEKIELQMALKFMKSPFFERKVRGINDLKDILQRAINAENKKSSKYSSYDQRNNKYTKWINYERFTQFLIEEQVMEYIYGPNGNPEFIKRSDTFFKVLAYQQKFTTQHVDLLWKAATDSKFEEVTRQTYMVINQLVEFVEPAIIAQFYSKIETLKESDIDEKTLEFLKDYSIITLRHKDIRALQKQQSGKTMSKITGLMNSFKGNRGNVPETDTKYFDLDIFWNILEKGDDQNKFKDAASTHLIEVLSIEEGQDYREVYIAKAVQRLKDSDSLRVLNFIKLLLKAFAKDSRRDATLSFQRLISDYNTKFNLIDLCLNNAQSYMKQANKQISIEENVDGKKLTHQLILTGQNTHEEHDTVKKHVFVNLMAKNPQEFIISEISYTCFQHMFVAANQAQGLLKFDIEQNRAIPQGTQDLLGYQVMLKVAIETIDEKIREKAQNFIVDLNLSINCKTLDMVIEKNRKFMQNIFAMLSKNDPLTRTASLSLLFNYLNRYDGNHVEAEDHLYEQSPNTVRILITERETKEKKEISIKSEQKLDNLRRKIADAFGRKVNDFRICAKDGFLGEEEYQSPLKAFQNPQAITIQFLKADQIEREYPRYILANTPAMIEALIKLIKDSNEVQARIIFQIIDYIPANRQFQEQLVGLEKSGLTVASTHQDWLKYINSTIDDYGNLFYKFKTIETLFVKPEYVKKFIDFNGFNFLCFVFQSVADPNRIIKDISIHKCFTVLTKLIKISFEHAKILDQNAEKVINQAVEVLKFFSQYLLDLSGLKPLKEQTSDKQEAELYEQTFELTVNVLSQFPVYLPKLYNQQIFTPLVKATLLQTKNILIRKSSCERLCQLSRNLDKDASVQEKPAVVFFNNLTQGTLLQTALDPKTSSDYYFYTLVYLLQESESIKELSNTHLDLDKVLTQNIMSREIIEQSNKEQDLGLTGMMMLLRAIFDKFGVARKQQHPELSKLMDYLLNEGLFLRTKLGYPKCKHIATRKSCLHLVEELTKGDPGELIKTIKFIEKFHRETDWRTKKKADWSINPLQEEKSETGFVGLKNIGCICYMNSLMQQLFMIPQCRKSILEVPNKSELKPEEDTLHQVQMIMGHLNSSQKQYYNPKSFVFAMKDIDGSPINPYEQRDVDEFFNMFMDDLENKIKGSIQDKAIKNVFQGKLVNEMICTGCPHYSERDEPFLNISLQVKNKKSVHESLEQYIDADVLDGDNAYHCEKCDKKVDALKRCCFKRLPNVLILALKRFDFNFDTMQKLKINDYCEFSQELDMYPYSQEFLDLQDLKKKMEKDGLTFDDLNSDQKITYKKKVPKQYYEYTLRGVVVHMGTSDAGHYYSFIKDSLGEKGGKQNQWYEFNDTLVKEFDDQDLPSETFGGDEDQTTLNMNRADMKYFKTKIRNAYLLFYERKAGHIDMEKFSEAMDSPIYSIDEVEMSNRFDSAKLATPETIAKQISPQQYILQNVEEKNNKFWDSMNIFTKDYLQTILLIVRVIKAPSNLDYVGSRQWDLQKSLNQKAMEQQIQLLEVMKFSVTFFLTTAIRGYDRSFIPGFVQLLRTYIKVNLPICIFILETFCHHEIIKEFLIYCPIPDLKRFVAGILNSAMQMIYQQEEKDILNFLKHENTSPAKLGLKVALSTTHDVKPIMTSKFERREIIVEKMEDVKSVPLLCIFMNNFIHMTFSLDTFKSSFMLCQFYQIYDYFADLGNTARLYLLEHKMLYRLIDCFKWGPVQQGQTPPFSDKRDLSDVLFFRINKPLYIGLSRDETQLSIIQKKQINESQNRSFKFLVMAISSLIRCINFNPTGQKSQFQLQPEYTNITDLEKEFITEAESQLYISLATECQKKVTRDAVSKAMAHVSFNNQQFTNQVIEFCCSNFNKLDFIWVKNLGRILVTQCQIRDDLKDSRHRTLLQKLFDVIQQNIDQHYKVTDSVVDLLLKLTAKDEHFRKIVISNKDVILRKIHKFTEQNPTFPQNQQKKRIFKKGIVLFNRFPHKIERETLQRLQNYSYERYEKLRSILEKNKVPPELEGYDSDDSLYKKDMNLNEEVDYLQVSLSLILTSVYNKEKSSSLPQWTTCRICCPANEMVKLQVSQRNSPWIELESDQVAGAKTMALSEKEWIHQFYMLLFNYYTQN